MSAEADDDLYLTRASAGLLSDLEHYLPKILWKRSSLKCVHQLVRLRDLAYIIRLIENFQGDPQLLDTKLKVLLPPTIEAYLAYLGLKAHKLPSPETTALDIAVSRILYTFCKVRGEKVVTGFLTNEPKYLDLVLSHLEVCDQDVSESDAPWERHYTLLLWLTHLLLTPFDLSSISGGMKPTTLVSDLDLHAELPAMVCRIIALGVKYIVSPTRAQEAAAKLLVRLATRPDMQRLQLPAALVSWALRSFSSPLSTASSSLHPFLGRLRFLVGIAASPDSQEVASLIPSIYSATQRLMDDPLFAFLTSSAVTKKLVIKLCRNTALLSLKPATGALLDFYESTTVLEDTIDYLLQSLADRDTPVRFAASKGLSLLILRLEPEFGYEVVQAVLDSLREDMSGSSLEADFSTVNPLRWHGLTLTLAHALFKRSASPDQLPEIFNALLVALAFEQRSMTGSSIGTNVRDAACFGIWSLARRYTTAELLSVDASVIHTGPESNSGHSVIQVAATQLLLSACLDPAGNIRRGSSAALQELIGRHPNQVSNGIALVQIVDYHAVGLRQRAMIDVSYGASCLDALYRRSLLAALLQWRGVGSVDVQSREAAAASVGRLCHTESSSELEATLDSVWRSLSLSDATDVEQSHGFLLTLSKIIDEKLTKERCGNDSIVSEDLSYLTRYWRLFEYPRKAYTAHDSRTLKAELAPAVAYVISSLADLSVFTGDSSAISPATSENVSTIVAGLVSQSEESTLQALPRMIRSLLTLKASGKAKELTLDLQKYLQKIESDSSSVVLHGAGRAIALGAAFPWLVELYSSDRLAVFSALGNLVQSSPAVEWRIIILRTFRLIIETKRVPPEISEVIVEALNVGLNDYTITERGDVGSLVRTQAIECVELLWEFGLLKEDTAAAQKLVAGVTRLSLEKLDRIRLKAARCLQARCADESHAPVADVSSVAYFRQSLAPIRSLTCPPWEREAILRGYVSCAGMSSEALLQASRAALVELFDTTDSTATSASMSTLTALLKQFMADGHDSQPLLELLAFLLQVLPALPQTIGDFNWRNLLALVQKSHFKSNHIPKILAAVDVYRGLADMPPIRPEVMKKLVSMLRTNPYPKVRMAVAECLVLLTGDEALKPVDWSRPGLNHGVDLQAYVYT
ncbi:hypothetical protein MBLNU459_g7354t1 [Dothideomycetes sp. NU459]